MPLPQDQTQDNPTGGKIGVLIGNLGTPDGTGYWPMRRYLREFLSDPRVVDAPRWKWLPILHLIILSRRPFTSGKNYRSIWNTEKDESPLLTITRDQSRALGAALQKTYGTKVIVDFCMRYGNPSTESRVNDLLEQGCDRILFLPLYPQYSAASTGTANDQMFRSLMKIRNQPMVRTSGPYFNHPKYIDALANSVKSAYATLTEKPDVLVTTYHGLPKRFVTLGDPYFDQCHQTTQLLQARLGWTDSEIITTFQSRFGREEWLQPYTVQDVARLAADGKKNIAVIAPAFSADCIETLEEINEEIGGAFKAAGGTDFTYIPCLNDSADHIDMMVAIISENLGGWV